MTSYDLSDYALIAVTGPDASKFLQGQVTCDIRQLAEDQDGGKNKAKGLYGAHCNHKGRILISFLASQTSEEQIVLRVHHSILQSSLKALGKYIVFSKAEVSDVSANYQCIGFTISIDDTFPASLNERFPELSLEPLAIGKALNNSNGTLIRLDNSRYECWIKQTQSLDSELEPFEAWLTLNIAAGIAEVRAETVEHFIPQYLNFQFIDAISFDKGCYTGQEIVARLHYRGQQKKFMQRFSVETTEQQPQPGETLQKNGKDAGEVIISSINNNHSELLAVISGENSNWTWQGFNLTPLALPYAITDSALDK